MTTARSGHGTRLAEEVVPSRLFVVGGFTPQDGRVNWLPTVPGRYAPSNVYVLAEPDAVLLVDTGLACFRAETLDGLKDVIRPARPVSLFMTRAELDCSGNLGPVAESFEFAGLHTGGRSNPFDSFDAAVSIRDGAAKVHLEVGRQAADRPIRVAGSRLLEIVEAPLRLLATYWGYDAATKTMFTSDSFGYMTVDAPGRSRIADVGSEVTLEQVSAFLLTKFDWMTNAYLVPVLEALDRVFASHDVENIAPTNGQVIQGRAAVERHLDLVRQALRNGVPRSAVVRPKVASGSAPQPASASQPPKQRHLPRQIAPRIQWLGGCQQRPEEDMPYHVHSGAYLLLGEERTLLVDTGHPSHWSRVEAELDTLLAGRALDWILPTHPEIPHCGNLSRLLRKFPRSEVVGDVRNYHLYYPGFDVRFRSNAPGDTLDLGGMQLVLLEAPIRDLPGTQWAYERTNQVLFVADAFGYTHHIGSAADDPVHKPGECGLLSTELPAQPTVKQTAFLTRAALYWTRFVDTVPYFAKVDALLEKYPSRIVAPAHANVITDLPALMPMMREAYQTAG